MPSFKQFDIAKHLDTPEMVAEYLNAVFFSYDARTVEYAMRVLAEKQRLSGIPADDNDFMRIDTVAKFIDALGYRIVIETK